MTTTSLKPSDAPILPPATLGVVGGGQLGRMFAHVAQRMGYRVVVLDPAPDSPAGVVADQHIQADYDDTNALQQLVSQCSAVTTEFENVPASSLEWLAQHTTVSPPANAVRVAQDRRLEKAHFDACGVAVAPYTVVAQRDDLLSSLQPLAPSFFPAILKTAQMGYDGKGQVTVRDAAYLPAAWQSVGQVPCVLEQRMPLAMELSVIVARGLNGQCVNLPVQRNLHRDGILAVTQVFDGVVPEATAHQAIASAKTIAAQLQYVGVLCVEFFVLQDGRLLVNEIAPRPHNSGHYSIEACDVSQFELQLRTLCHLPLKQPMLQRPAIMLNLLGDVWHAFNAEPPWAQVLSLSGVALHLYGKSDAKLGRKMGHITITGDTAEDAQQTAWQVCDMLRLERFA